MINNVTIMGRLTADPILKTTTSGKSVTSFSVAVDRGYKTDGKTQADFIPVVAWEQKAEFVCKYFKKGVMIALTGSLRSRSYEDRHKQKRTVLEIYAEDISFCGSKSDSSYSNAEALTQQSMDTYYVSPGMTADYFDEIPDDEDLPF